MSIYLYLYPSIYLSIYLSIYVYIYCVYIYTHKLFRRSLFIDSEAVLDVWLPAPLPTPRALPDHGALWPLAVGVEKYLGGIDV